ncbi:F-box/kelch-repeat protein At3g23880-like [Apium graveolens]|uniref:F-box/kelch-repeat protein At3g23880-like n=1 Tax=Apium graveolens TaxID=4045 RepID=UPI003D78B948
MALLKESIVLETLGWFQQVLMIQRDENKPGWGRFVKSMPGDGSERDDDCATEAIKIDSPIKNESRGFAKIVGCNGLVCLHIEKSSARCTEPVGLFFWNPFTRKIRRLPELIIEPEKFGLGYEESSDDFKLFVIAAGHGDYEKKVSVYCSKSNSWKGNGDFPSGIVLDNGIFADGAVHWVTQRMNMESQTIVSVDVKNQTLRDLVLPTTNGGCLDYWITLGSFGKSLSVVHSLLHGYSSHECDIWMLNKCDAKESWTKVFTFPVNGLPVCCPDLTPLCICVNGDILLRSGTNLWLYNSKDNTLNVLSHKKFDENYVYSSTCVESLFSP